MPVFLIADLDYSDVNFRIFSSSLDDLVAGTVCDIGHKFGKVSIPTYTVTKLNPSSHIFNIQQKPLPVIPKAYSFNEHNGVTFESSHAFSPAYTKEVKHYNGFSEYSKPSWYKGNFQDS